jgi:hypothetical protein
LNQATAEYVFIEELKLLGVDKNSVLIDQDNRSGLIKVDFEWAYPGASVKQYSVTFINSRMELIAAHQTIQDVLAQGIEIYYQSASMDLPRHYALYMPLILESLNPEGFIMTDDVGADDDRNIYNPGEFFNNPEYGITSALDDGILKSKEREIRRIRRPQVSFLGNQDYALVNIRKKVFRSRGGESVLTDAAMVAPESRRVDDAPGGIDFDPRQLAWDIVGDDFLTATPEKLIFDPQFMNPASFNALVPVIESMIPLTDVSGFWGS